MNLRCPLSLSVYRALPLPLPHYLAHHHSPSLPAASSLAPRSHPSTSSSPPSSPLPRLSLLPSTPSRPRTCCRAGCVSGRCTRRVLRPRVESARTHSSMWARPAPCAYRSAARQPTPSTCRPRTILVHPSFQPSLSPSPPPPPPPSVVLVCHVLSAAICCDAMFSPPPAKIHAWPASVARAAVSLDG